IPGIDINPAGEIGMTFIQIGSAAGQFMSVYITGRIPTDALGTMEPPVLTQAGAGINFDGRAGDMSGVTVDSDGSFWIANEFTDANSAWGSSIANFALEVGTSSITGSVFNDLNGDGVRQGGEPGLNNWTLYLDLNKNNSYDPGEPTAVSNAQGNYTF